MGTLGDYDLLQDLQLSVTPPINILQYVAYANMYIRDGDIDRTKTTSHYRKTQMRMFFAFWLMPENVGMPLNPELALKWKQHLSKCVGAATLAKYMNTMHNFFVWCLLLGYTRHDSPFEHVKKVIPPPKVAYEIKLDFDQVHELLRSVGSEKTKTLLIRTGVLINIILTTAMRVSEVTALRFSDIDMDEGWIRIASAKGKVPRFVSFPRVTRSAISLYLNSSECPPIHLEDPFVFGTSHMPGQEWAEVGRIKVFKQVKKYIEHVTGVAGVSPHDLRHVAAHYMLHKGVSLELLQSTLGHAHFSTTELYTGRIAPKLHKGRSSDIFEDFEH